VLSGIAAPFFIIFGMLLPLFIIFVIATRLFFLAFLMILFIVLLTAMFVVVAYTETSKNIESENKALLNQIKGNYTYNVKNK
jgi:hypothetical protein